MRQHNKLWNDYTPLMKSATNGLLEWTKSIMETGDVDVDEQKGWNNVTALMLAAQTCQFEVLCYLVEKGANIELTNDMGNTALMLAAEAGHIEIVKYLASKGANIGAQNEYKHTALILACENGRLEVVKWIATEYPKQISVRNQYQKTSLIVAAEFGKVDVVRWLIENKGELDIDVNITTGRGLTPLMLACGGGTPQHHEIAKILIHNGAEVNARSKNKDTALIWAAIGGNVGTIQTLIDGNANVNDTNELGFTALIKASERGHEKAVQTLIQAGADRWIAVNDVTHQDKKMDAMKLAWLNGHVELATNHFMIPLDKELQLLSRPVIEIFNEEEIDDIAKKYANPAHFKSLRSLVVHACSYDFHFDLFIKMIPRFKTPNTVLNKPMIIMYKTLYKLSYEHDVYLVHKLVQLAAAFAAAAANHPLEKIDLQDRINSIVLMLTECLNSDCMDDERNVQKILCAAVTKHTASIFADDLVEQAQAFLKGPLETCIAAKVTALFCTGHVSTYVDNLFWGFLRKQYGRSFTIPPTSMIRLFPMTQKYSKDSENIRYGKSIFVHFRFSPAAMFFGEGISKVGFLLLVAWVSVTNRNAQYRETDQCDFVRKYVASEIVLAVWAFAMCTYEYGQLCDSTITMFPNTESVAEYLSDIWNCLDDSGLVLVVLFFLLKFVFCLPFGALACLSLSTIFFSISSMRYLSIDEAIGKLIIMVFAMMGELRSFAAIFIIFIFGFCVTLYCLLPDEASFHTIGQTILTLFSASVQNYDSTFHSLTDARYYSLPIIVEIAYILLTSVVLINLIIARMSAIFQKN